MLVHLVPVDHFPEGSEVVGALVLIFEIISMFPYVHAEERRAFHFGHIHERVILVGRGRDLELAVLEDEPGPAATETADAGGIEFFLEGVEAAEGSMNIIC